MARADVMAGRAYVSLYTKKDQLTRGLQAAKAEANKFGSDMMSIGARMVAMSAAIATPIAFATKTFADFDDAMRMVGAVSQATAAQLASMTDVAEELGRTTSFTAIQVAQLMTELGRAGFKPDQVNAMTGAVLNLARATGTDATLASGIMAATIRQFGLEATDATRVSDVFTLAANETFNSVESLGEALKYAGPVAASLGMSLEDTMAILGTLGNVGIQGSEAGTALRRLSVISAATGKELKATFGISNVDAAGNLKPLVQIMGEIGKAVQNMPVAERVEKMNEAFGLLGITASTVMSQAVADTEELSGKLNKAAGTAERVAKEADSGIGGSFRIIMSSVEGLQIALGEALSGSIKTVTETITGLVGQATEWVTKNQDLVTTIAAVTIAAAGLGSALIAIGVSAKIAAFGIGVLVAGVGMVKSVVLTGLSAINLFRAATVGLATIMQAAFTTSAVASTGAVAALTAAQTVQTIIMKPYIAATVVAGNATAFLGMNAAATTVALIAQSNALALTAVASGAASTGLIAASGAMTLATAGGTGLIATSAGASAGLITIAGSSVVAAAGVGTVSASAGVMATAWASASAVIGAAWGVIMGPITPFILAAGAAVAVAVALGAAAVYLAVAGLDFSEAWATVTGTLTELMAVAKRVGGVLMEALGGGDYDIAMAGTLAGIKLAMASAIDGMAELWVQFWNGLWSAAKNFAVNFINLQYKIITAIGKAMANPLQAASAIKGALADVMNGKISIGIDTAGMRDSANAELDKLEKELEARKAKRDAERKAKDADQQPPGAGNGQPGAGGDGAPFGDMNAAQIEGEEASKKAASAFDRETEALQQQIIALRQGEEAAERFRLSKQGLTEDQIAQVMALKAEEEALKKEQEASQRSVRMIQEFADADYKKNKGKLSSADIEKKEKASIEAERQMGGIDDKTAAEATKEAEIRHQERLHKERLAKFTGEDEGSASSGLKSSTASAATFSAASLVAMGSSSGGNGQLQVALGTKKAIELQTKQQKELHVAELAAFKNLGLHHA